MKENLKIITLIFLAVAGVTVAVLLLPNNSDSFKHQKGGNWDYVSSAKATGITASFAKAPTSATVQLEKDGHRLTFVQEMAKPSLKIDGDQLVYTDSTSSTEVRYTTIDKGIKEEIVLHRPPVSNLFEIKMQMAGMTVSTNKDDLPVFYDKQGNYLFHFQKPWAKDAKGSITYNLRYILQESRNGSQASLTLELEKGWLADPTRVYPITIDPTVVTDPQSSYPEVPANRTAQTRTFSLGSNRFATTSYLDQVNYRDEEGSWQKIDFGLDIQSDEVGFDYSNISNAYKTYFKKDSSGFIAKYKTGNAWLKLQPLANSILGEVNLVGSVVNDNSITYPQIYSGVDLKFSVGEIFLEEFIVDDREKAMQIVDLVENIVVSGVVAQNQVDGSIRFKDSKTNQILWTFPKPVMYELANRGKETYGLHYEITCLEGQNSPEGCSSFKLAKTIDAEGKVWLEDSSRVYPIVIDASAGPSSPGTVADDGTVGSVAWGYIDGVKAYTDPCWDSSCAALAYPLTGVDSIEVFDNSIKIVKSGTILGDEKSTGTAFPPLSFAYNAYGSSTDKWGLTWGYSDINGNDFGVAFSAMGDTATAHYLKATNFGFSIPAGSTVDGILAEIRRYGQYIVDVGTVAYVDHIRITVYYSPPPSMTFSGVSLSGIEVNRPPCSELWYCGCPLTKAHVASGGVAPVDKAVTYGTVLSSIAGTGSKCWITQNLGATDQASSATDSDEDSAGWYWQFNRKQGYKHDGTTRTPATAWITSISENAHWADAQDPCRLELGTGWRLPTSTEWGTADSTGGWDNRNETYASVLKLHAAGYLFYSTGVLTNLGNYGIYWSSTQQTATNGYNLFIDSGNSLPNYAQKATGFSVRCLKD